MYNTNWHLLTYNCYGEEKTFKKGNYTILWNSTNEQYVVAYFYNPEDNTWGQGHYFDDLYDALDYMITATR